MIFSGGRFPSHETGGEQFESDAVVWKGQLIYKYSNDPE